MRNDLQPEIDRANVVASSFPLVEPVALKGVSVIPDIRVIDEALDDAEAYRLMALSASFRDVQTGAITFHGLAAVADDRFGPLVSALTGLPIGLTFFRRSPIGQVEPNYIHTDRDMGELTGILFLTLNPIEGDGTTFWRHLSGAYQSASADPSEFMGEWLAWQDDRQWDPWMTVEAKFNRAVIFPAAAFHSRAIRENYGHGNDARLTQVAFARRVA